MISCRVTRIIPRALTTKLHACYKSSINLKIDSTPLMRGLSAALFWNLPFLKRHISRGSSTPTIPLPSTRTKQILWQLREGGKRESAGDSEGERRREERARRESLERRCRCSMAPSRRLHANEEIPLQQAAAAAAAVAAAVVEQSSRRGPRCWHCTSIVLDSHITHSSQKSWRPDGFLEENAEKWPNSKSK